MKKRLLATMLALCLLLALLPVSVANAVTEIPYPVIGGNIYTFGATVSRCDASVTEVVIPEEVNGTAITMIADNAFSGCKSLQKITFSENIIAINSSAFANCTALREVYLDDQITAVWNNAFYNCTGLEKVYIGKGVQYLSDGVFNNCSNLTRVTGCESLVKIGDSTFRGCSKLYTITLPVSLTEIGRCAFIDCTNLTTVRFFGNAPALDEQYGTYVFGTYEAINENSGNFYKSTTVTLSYLEGNTDWTTPTWNGYPTATWTTDIQRNDWSFTVLPDGTAEIAGYSGNLTDITLPYDVDGLAVAGIADNAFAWTGITSLSIPDSVTRIGDGAFTWCKHLKSVYIGNGLSDLGGDWAFKWCDNLTAFSISNSNPNFSVIDGVLFDKTAQRLICYPCGKADSSYTVPNTVTVIDAYAFSYALKLTSVILNENVQELRRAAFQECNNLKSICFKGNAPVADDGVFDTFDYTLPLEQQFEKAFVIPGLTLYYIAGKTGWTSPKWKGCPTATWDGKTIPQKAGAEVFNDVERGKWYYDAVDYAVKNGLFNGISANTFEPNTPMNRAMLVTVLWRYEGEPKPAGAASFADVASGKWYTDAVLWAAENGIVGGVGNGKFDPTGNVTREQMAAILFRYCEKKGIDKSKRTDLSSFPDANQVSAFAKVPLSWAVAEKLIGGTVINGKTYLDPKGSATRAQVATILMRFLENVVK